MQTTQQPRQRDVHVAGYVLTRRQFVGALGASLGTSTVVAMLGTGVQALGAQEGEPAQSAATNVQMNQDAAKTVRRPPKPNARPQLSKEQMEALEHKIRCNCGCTLDVYTCRTTDFSCGVSPAMHRDVLSLIDGGYGADEIIDAFVDTYGEQVLMAPKKEGFNLAGYWMPFAALGAGGVVLATLIRRWGQRAAAAHAHAAAHHNGNGASPLAIDATPEELARLEAAVRAEED